jgi:hypothetical protein
MKYEEELADVNQEDQEGRKSDPMIMTPDSPGAINLATL